MVCFSQVCSTALRRANCSRAQAAETSRPPAFQPQLQGLGEQEGEVGQEDVRLDPTVAAVVDGALEH